MLQPLQYQAFPGKIGAPHFLDKGYTCQTFMEWSIIINGLS